MYPEEEIIKKKHPNPIGYLPLYLSGVVALVFGIIFLSWPLGFIGIAIIVIAELSRRAETYYILTTGVAREHRLLTTSRDFAEYDKIQNIKVTQSFFEHILEIGTVRIDTAGGDVSEVNFKHIGDPYRIEAIIREKMKEVK